MDCLRCSLTEVWAVTRALERELPKVEEAARLIVTAFQSGNKMLVAGNGGSAADAGHFSAEFEGKFDAGRRGFPALCLCSGTSFLTAWCNDYSFDSIYARQVENHGRPGDIFVGISTSGGSDHGYSRNVVIAATRARELGLKIVGLAGKGGGRLRDLADVCLIVDSNTTARVQEAHGILLHLIVEAFEALIQV